MSVPPAVAWHAVRSAMATAAGLRQYWLLRLQLIPRFRRQRTSSSEASQWWLFFFSSRRRHTRFKCDWSSDVCSSDLRTGGRREMTIGAPAIPVMVLSDVDPPALIIDLDAFERNLGVMADSARRLGMRLRPHAKTHKSPIIALKQMRLGAVGVCCQKVSEAEALVRGGVGDVL